MDDQEHAPEHDVERGVDPEGSGPAAGDVPNEREAAAEFPHGDDRSLVEQRGRFDADGDDIRQYTGEPVETEYGTVLPQQSVVGSQRVVGGGEFPAAPPRGDDDDDDDERDVERLDPDAPGRSMFTPGEDAVEPNEPA
jgi:hypothetical protein